MIEGKVNDLVYLCTTASAHHLTCIATSVCSIDNPLTVGCTSDFFTNKVFSSNLKCEWCNRPILKNRRCVFLGLNSKGEWIFGHQTCYKRKRRNELK